ncbi:hypothetical protein HU200_055635 [Digitaria exilis]|uniref:R13L1/DRL21-like LRR repeat region domain-containing protein n=1 Tax=Digitaria exilis TaxID=1010633 RepID=A0A835ADR2_9POAL|nr:hypothetical protein HU200_055635 [Digitaria exilis]
MSLETIPRFVARTEQGYKLKQLEHLNKLRNLQIDGLRFVTSKEEALEANLACKNLLTELEMNFYSHDSACNPDVQAAVLEGLSPSKHLVHLKIEDYSGSSYPSWMLYPSWSGLNSGAPTELYSLELFRCSPLVSIPKGSGYFIRLHKLCFSRCRWSCMPLEMEHLESLQELTISLCGRIKHLSELPKSLKLVTITGKSKLWKTCQKQGHQNYQKIQHIPNKEFPVETDDLLY